MSATEAPPSGGTLGRPGDQAQGRPAADHRPGPYVDDLQLPGMVHAAFVRSTEAHANITSIDVSAAAAPGVLAVLTGDDLDFLAPLPMVWVPPGVEVPRPSTVR